MSMTKKEQQEMARLRMRLAESTDLVRQFTGETPTDTVLADIDGDRYLPRGARVRFILGSTPEEYLDCRIDEGTLYVMAGRRAAVYPESVNTLRIASMRVFDSEQKP